MHVVSRYPDGIFCWVDLSTSDIAGAKAFYQSLFGWEARDLPTGTGSNYTMFLIDGKSVAGAGPMPADMKQQGLPPFWTSYVKHDDVDAVAGRVSAAGGQLLFPPMDVMAEGRMMMAVDPTGATFGVWQPGNHIGAQLVNRPNALVWNELQTRDVEAAKGFYAAVFAWEPHTDAGGYVLFQLSGRTHAGMMAMDESWGDVPPNWAVYFLVDDAKMAAARVTALGGNVLVPPSRAGEMGTFAVVQDPQGGIFTVMQFDGPVDPPPGF